MSAAGESGDDPRGAVPAGDGAAALDGAGVRPPQAGGVQPVVRLPRGGVPLWAIIIGVIVAGLLLFSVLDARRRSLSAPAVALRPTVGSTDAATGQPPLAPLYIPPEPPPPAPVLAPPPPPPAPKIVYMPPPPQPVRAVPVATATPAQTLHISAEPVLVIDTGAPPAGIGTSTVNQPRLAQAPNQNPAQAAQAAQAASAATSAATATGDRVRSSVFANPSTTVVQGTLIQAVLETALDSTRPGYARATVQRDVRGFDGKNILIPRGTKLIGSYNSQVAQGQKRALVSWDRLIRPDGVTIAISSPAADPEGGGGIPAKVNDHFFERFGGTILQSVLNIGTNVASALASQAVNNTVVVLPNGTTQNIAAPQLINPGQITPTLTVKAGTSIGIFVARDLDFTGAAAGAKK